ncbi:MAG: toll/interleukin-1 receptor domain-containing protein [Nevskia sp.]|nr:toll/interleukin-1 receptor domain-containing protein [Nevskia sp.]
MADSGEGFRYRAFISYSHADARWAAWLQRKLERFRVPPHLSGRLQDGRQLLRRIGRVFRDRTELATSSDLGATLRQALAQSQNLIVICSPAAAASRWVNAEVRAFRALGRGAAIHCLIVEGVPQAPPPPEGRGCFAPALLRSDDGLTFGEHLAADVRRGADGRHDAALKIAAALLGVGFEELRRRELQRRQRRLTLVSAAAVAFGAVTAGLALEAYRARDQAEQRRVQAEALINFMLGDLRDKLQPVGRLEVLDAVAQKALAYFDAVDQGHPGDASRAARATALVEIARYRSAQGQLAAGIAAAREAVGIGREQARRHPADVSVLFVLGDALSTVAELQLDAGDAEAARAGYREFGQTMDRVLALDRGSRAAREKLADAEDQLAMLDIGAADYASALRHTEAAVAYLQALHAEAPQLRTASSSLGQELAWRGYELYFLGRLKEARAANAETVAFARRQLAADPGDVEWQYSLARFLEHSGAMAEADGDFEASLRDWTEADGISRRLVEHDPRNMEWLAWRGAIQLRLGVLQLKRGESGSAQQLCRAGQATLEQVFRRDPAQLKSRTAYSNGLLVSADLALLLRRDTVAAQDAARQVLALWQGVEPDDIAGQSILRAHLIQAEAIGPHRSAATAELQSAHKLLDAIGTANQSHEVLELRARYAYLEGDLAGGDAGYRQLVATGDRQPFLARIRAALCAQRKRRGEATCRSVP